VIQITQKDDSKAGPTQDQMQVVSVRPLSELDRVIVHPRIRQFIALSWWTEGTSSSSDSRPERESLIFESADRRRGFREMIQLVPQLNSKRTRKTSSGEKAEKRLAGLPEMALAPEVIGKLQDAVKGERTSPIVSITFIKGESAIPGLGSSIDVLVLTKASAGIVKISSFLRLIATVAWPDGPEAPEAVCDSDSDEDVPMKASPVKDFDDHNLSVEHARGGPWKLNELQGVWFLADSHPRVNLQFSGQPLKLAFFTDAERQRWRQQLAAVLAALGAGEGELASSQGWSVVPTDKTNIAEVKKAAQAALKESQGMKNGQNGSQPLALSS